MAWLLLHLKEVLPAGSYFTIPPQIQMEIASRQRIITDEYSGRILVDAELANEEKDKNKQTYKFLIVFWNYFLNLLNQYKTEFTLAIRLLGLDAILWLEFGILTSIDSTPFSFKAV